jgi:hypothetical protein
LQRRYGLAASLTLHLLLIAAVLTSTRAPIDHAPRPPPAIELLDLSRHRAGTLLEAADGAPGCVNGKFYRGIGMQFDWDAVVVNVPRSYPAFEAGIRLGDVVANPETMPDSAGYETIEYTRRGRLHRTRVKTRWICLR